MIIFNNSREYYFNTMIRFVDINDSVHWMKYMNCNLQPDSLLDQIYTNKVQKS